MRTGVISLIFAVFAVGCLSAPADARPTRGDDAPAFDQILPNLRAHQPGTFSDADGPFTGSDGRQHYRVKWLTPQGRVIWFDADARTGRVTNRDDAARDRGGFDRTGNDDDSGRDNKRTRRNRLNGDDSFDNPFDDGERRSGNRRRNPNDDDGFGRPDRGGGRDRGNSPDGSFGGFGNHGGNRPRGGHGNEH